MLAFTPNVSWAGILASIRLQGEGLLSCLPRGPVIFPASLSCLSVAVSKVFLPDGCLTAVASGVKGHGSGVGCGVWWAGCRVQGVGCGA